jgi:hypothetical protein
MGRTYEESVSELYRCSPEEFVAERKRLAAELKGTGDKEGAERFEKLARPSLSAWAVNQLWWQERAGFEQLLEAAARLRAGDLGARGGHRHALDELRKRAAEILRAGEHAASDAVLRRVSTTLSALAANGGFDPDAPGALTADREAPGFEATGLSGMLAAAGASEQERQRVEQERKQAEQERQRAAARAELERLETELQRARAAAEGHTHEVDRLRKALAAEEQRLERAQAAVAELEARLRG